MALETGKTVSASGLDIIRTKPINAAPSSPNGLRKMSDLEGERPDSNVKGLLFNNLAEVLGIGNKSTLLASAIAESKQGNDLGSVPGIAQSGFMSYEDNKSGPGKMRF